jgi:hypothetical protein
VLAPAVLAVPGLKVTNGTAASQGTAWNSMTQKGPCHVSASEPSIPAGSRAEQAGQHGGGSSPAA